MKCTKQRNYVTKGERNKCRVERKRYRIRNCKQREYWFTREIGCYDSIIERLEMNVG